MAVEARFVIRLRNDDSVHGTLKVKRADGLWHTIGVFDLRADEWAELARFCDRKGIEILTEAEDRR